MEPVINMKIIKDIEEQNPPPEQYEPYTKRKSLFLQSCYSNFISYYITDLIYGSSLNNAIYQVEELMDEFAVRMTRGENYKLDFMYSVFYDVASDILGGLYSCLEERPVEV